MTHLVELNMGPTSKFVIAIKPITQAETFSTIRAGRDVIYFGDKAAALVTTDKTDPGALHEDYQHAQGLEATCKRHGVQRVVTRQP
jgi:hypothetical protein